MLYLISDKDTAAAAFAAPQLYIYDKASADSLEIPTSRPLHNFFL